MSRHTLTAALLLALSVLITGCASPPPEDIADVRVTEGDLPNSFAAMDLPPDIDTAFSEATRSLYEAEPAATYAYQNRNGRSRVMGFSINAPAEASMQQLVEAVITGFAPEALTSGAEALPAVQMDIIGEQSHGTTFTLPRTDPNQGDQEYIMRVNTIAAQRGPHIALVIVTFEDRTAAPVDVYSMARRLDSRLTQLDEPGDTAP
jgi:hypothetical protein